MKFNIDKIIQNIKNTYDNKYNGNDFTYFKSQAVKAKNKKQIINLIQNLFDLDKFDAIDMVD